MKPTSSATNFFERQDKARRSSRLLVFAFTAALLATSAAIYFVARIPVAVKLGENLTLKHFPEWNEMFPFLAVSDESFWWDPLLLFIVLALTTLFVGGASLMKILEFGSTTGAKVAEELGGREVSLGTNNAEERQLINIVQEMSLASGVPVPRIFILENENGINAFAAGTTIDRAAIAVSRGAMDKLARDELQAVIGHEYSHILNGDMRLNVRLIGWIFGLVALAIGGRILMQSGLLSGSSREKENNGRTMLVIVGIAILIIGSIGQFFAQCIQAAISRQREHLADASATQFTRNPIALANALSRIGGDNDGSRLSSPRAEEYAHFFFADGLCSFFSQHIFATHPPLEERIRALNPNWDGKFLPPLNNNGKLQREQKAVRQNAHQAPQHFAGAAYSLKEIPFPIDQITQDLGDTKALIYLLMMTDSPSHNVEQAKLLLEREPQHIFKKMEYLWPKMSAYPREKRISGVLLAAPTLRQMHARERTEFCETLKRLAETDGKITLYEFCILNAVKGILIYNDSRDFSAAEVAPEITLVLNLFLRESSCPADRQERVLAAAKAVNPDAFQDLHICADNELNVTALGRAFENLRNTDIMLRSSLIDAAKVIISEDNKITASEGDLLKAFAVALGCPMPQI